VRERERERERRAGEGPDAAADDIETLRDIIKYRGATLQRECARR
jgi:hypothetical protein